jgi:hypothetical protein
MDMRDSRLLIVYNGEQDETLRQEMGSGVEIGWDEPCGRGKRVEDKVERVVLPRGDEQ